MNSTDIEQRYTAVAAPYGEWEVRAETDTPKRILPFTRTNSKTVALNMAATLNREYDRWMRWSREQAGKAADQLGQDAPL